MWRFCLDSRTFYQKASIKLKNSKMRRLLGTWKGCLEVHMWIQVHTCVCSEARCQHLPASPMSVLHLTGFFETESLTEPAHHWVPRLTGQQEHFCLLLPSTEIMGVPPHDIPNFLFICLFSESAKDSGPHACITSNFSYRVKPAAPTPILQRGTNARKSLRVSVWVLYLASLSLFFFS